MNKRNIIFMISFLAVFFFMSEQSFAFTAVPQKNTNISVVSDSPDNECEETDVIKKVSFRNMFKKTPEAQITDFYKKYNKYSAKNDIEKLDELYEEEYINNDGFDKKTIFKMMALASDNYKDVKYNTEILFVDINDNYATVKIHEIAQGKTSQPIEKLKDTGLIYSDIYYTDYLVKHGNQWKISATNVSYEEVDLKYGEAKKMAVKITAPDCVTANSDYDVTVKIDAPPETFVVGSIVNEQIIYPQIEEKDVFRTVKNGEFARILKANKNGYNEYATASIAITRAHVDPDSVALSMTGMSFNMKRINVLSVKNNKSLEKENLNAKQTKNSKK